MSACAFPSEAATAQGAGSRQSLVQDVVTIHTLGPEGTSSEYTAKHIAGRVRAASAAVRLHRTFEDASAAALETGKDVLLVANAYPDVRRFYMDRSLSVLGCLIYKTPLYGLAVRAEQETLPPPDGPLQVVTHPSPVALFGVLAPSEMRGSDVKFHLATSTSNAAARVRSGEFSLCITNETSARLEGLRFIGQMLPITMVWSLFCPRSDHARAVELFRDAVPCLSETP